MLPVGNDLCAECGMAVRLGEYHPFLACLAFKGCHDGDTVRANIKALATEWRDIGLRECEAENTRLREALGCLHKHTGDHGEDLGCPYPDKCAVAMALGENR